MVPAEITTDGKASWGRQSAWSRAWIAPQRQSGMRLVATMGDADDHDRMPLPLLVDASSDRTGLAAAALGRKYGAPAVILVRLDDRDMSVSVWMWRSGAMVAEEGGTVVSVDEGRTAGLSALTRLVSPVSASNRVVASQSADADDYNATTSAATVRRAAGPTGRPADHTLEVRLVP